MFIYLSLQNLHFSITYKEKKCKNKRYKTCNVYHDEIDKIRNCNFDILHFVTKFSSHCVCNLDLSYHCLSGRLNKCKPILPTTLEYRPTRSRLRHSPHTNNKTRGRSCVKLLRWSFGRDPGRTRTFLLTGNFCTVHFSFDLWWWTKKRRNPVWDVNEENRDTRLFGTGIVYTLEERRLWPKFFSPNTQYKKTPEPIWNILISFPSTSLPPSLSDSFSLRGKH